MYRRRGLGRYLINRIKQNSNYPIYIICCPESYLFEICNSLGFVVIEENELPRRIIKSKQYIYIETRLKENNIKITEDIDFNIWGVVTKVIHEFHR